MKVKFFTLLFLAFITTFIAFDSKAGDRPVTDSMIGKTVTLQSALLIIKDSSTSDSVTARHINQIGQSLDDIIGCAVCSHKSEQLTKLLLKGQRVTITDAYEDVPGIFEFDAVTVRYFIAKTEGLIFVVPDGSLKSAMTDDGISDDQKVARYDQLLESFRDEQEVKDFYINVPERMQPALFPNNAPPYSDRLIERHYQPILSELANYGAARGEFGHVLFGFPVKVNRRALAFIMLNSANLYIDISPYQKL